MQLHTHVMARLSRWVIWCLWQHDLLTPQPGPRSVKSWWHPMVTRPRMRVPDVVVMDRRPCPVDEIECSATDICVGLLPEKLRAAVVVGYMVSGTALEKAERLGCSRRSYFNRLDCAYAKLLGLMNDYEAGIVRVDVVQASVELAACAPLTDTECLTELHSGPRIRATLV